MPAPEPLATAFDDQALFYLAERIVPARVLRIELTLDERGAVTAAAIDAFELPAHVKREVLAHLRTLSFRGVGVPAGRYRFLVTRRRLEETREQGTQIFEEAPYPLQEVEPIPPPTHMHERVPAPPLEQGRKRGEPEKS